MDIGVSSIIVSLIIGASSIITAFIGDIYQRSVKVRFND